MDRRLDVAVVGCGGMGWTDIATLVDCKYVSRVVGVEPNADRAARTREKFDIDVVDRIDDVLADDRIELVYITSPGAYHADQAIMALECGKKVMSEKPMGTTFGQLDRVVEAQQRTDGFLQVGFECRYSKLYMRIKQIVDSGEIGSLRHVNFNYHLSPYPLTEHNGRQSWKFLKDASGGIFTEKLCHYVDLVRWWVNEPVTQFLCVAAPNTIPYYETPDNIQATYAFGNGVVSHLTFMMQAAESGEEGLAEIDIADQVNDGHRLSYVLVGTQGAIEASVFHRELRVFHHPGKDGYGDREHMVRVERWGKDDDHAYFHNTTDQNIDIAQRVACGLAPAIDIEDAAETMRLCFEMEQAAIDGHWDVVTRNGISCTARA